MPDIKVTIYIPSYNYGRYLQEAIESVLRQTVDNWELILVNDNSLDNTKEIMDLYSGDTRISVYNTQNIGLPRVANFALNRARGKYIIRLDADDVFDENILLVLSNYLDRHSGVALVFPDYFLVDDQGGIIHYERRKNIYHSNHLLDIPANGACTLIRKSVLEEMGGYREDLGAQDGFDLWTRVLRNHKCANVNLPLFYYRRHGENLTQNRTHIMSARRIIKKDACKVDIDGFRPIIAVIPCRKNYDLFPDLWSKRIDGISLLDISIKTCLSSEMFDQIVVISDTPGVKENMAKYSDSRLKFIRRSSESTTYSRSIAETLEQVVKKMEIGWRGISVLCYVQAPFVKKGSLEEAVNTVVLNDADSAFAVEEMEEYMYRRTSHGLMPITSQNRIKSDFDIIYASSPSASATQNKNLKTGSLTGARISHFIIPKEEAFFIRNKRDFRIAELLKRDGRLKANK